MTAIEEAREYRVTYQKHLLHRGFTKPQSEFLTGIKIGDSQISTLIPYCVVDPGRLFSSQYKLLFQNFPELSAELQKYNTGSSKLFSMSSGFTENVAVPISEREVVWSGVFERWPGVWEVK